MTEVAPAVDGAPGPPSRGSRHPPHHTRKEQAALDWSHHSLRALPDLRYVPLNLTRHVRALNLSSNALLKLNGLEHLPCLESLNVSSNRLVRLDLAQNVNLTTLDASHNSLMAIAGLGGCLRLAHVSLANNCISTIEGLDHQRSLETLDVSHNACETLGDISLCGKLTHCDLSHNAISTLHGASSKLPNALRVLNLGYNELIDVSEIKHLAPCANLVSLILRGNPLFAFAASCGFEPRAVIAFALPRLAALDDEGASTAAWSATARTSLFRNDAGELCPDLLRLLGEGTGKGLHSYLASAVPAAPFSSGLWQAANTADSGSTGAVGVDAVTRVANGPKGGSMYTTSSFVPVDLWSPGPSPTGSPVENRSPAPTECTDFSVLDVSESIEHPLDKMQSIARVGRKPRAFEKEISGKASGKSALATITNQNEQVTQGQPDGSARDETASATDAEMEELRQRLEREAAAQVATENELHALRASITERVVDDAPESSEGHENAESSGVDTDSDDAADIDVSAPDLRVLALAAAQAETPTPSAAAAMDDALADTPVSAQRDRLAAARLARAASRDRDVTFDAGVAETTTPIALPSPLSQALGLTPVPNSPAEFSVSDVSLSPSPIPVTLAARVAENVATGSLSSRTPIAMSGMPTTLSTLIPMSPVDGFDFSVSDVSLSREYDATRDNTLELRNTDSELVKRSTSFASFASGAETDDTRGTEYSSEYGGLPGVESFLRDAAAQRAWDVVVGLIASSADDETDGSDVSFLRDKTKETSGRSTSDRSISGRSTGSRTEGSSRNGTDITDGSSLVTLPGADAWLASAETEKKRARGSSRGDVSGDVSGSGNVSSGASDSASRGLGRSSGMSGSDRSTSQDTLPGADDWLKSPGAKGAIDAYEHLGIKAPFDDASDDHATETETSNSSGSGSRSYPRPSGSPTHENLTSRSISPSPPPPSDRALADALRQKINKLRVVAKRNDEALAFVRGPSPLSRETRDTATEGDSAGTSGGQPSSGRQPSSDPSGSSSVDPTTVSRAKSKVELEYEAFASTMGTGAVDTWSTEDTEGTGDTNVTVNKSVDDSDVFQDPLDATARSSTFASASEHEHASFASPARREAFDADALVSSTFDTVFGGDVDATGGGGEDADGEEDTDSGIAERETEGGDRGYVTEAP